MRFSLKSRKKFLVSLRACSSENSNYSILMTRLRTRTRELKINTERYDAEQLITLKFCESIKLTLKYALTCYKYWTSFSIVYLKLGSSCRYHYDSSAFLFSLVNKPGWQPLKLDQTGWESYRRQSIYSCSYYGPTFGNGNDIHIHNNASSNTNSYTDLGVTYSRPASGDTRSFLAGSHYFRPDEVEVFYETT